MTQLTNNLLKLSKDTGYPIVQSNGQRKFGPPPGWEGPAPPKGCEIFIGKIPRDILEDELVPLFSRVGKIYEFRLMMDFSGSNRGYGFVTYTTKEDASAAIRQLNNYQIRPKIHLGVVKSVDNCRLFIGKLPSDVTREQLLIELAKYVSGIVNVIMYKNCYNRNFNRGFAFVEFTSHREAAMARRALVPGFFKLWGKDLHVDWAEPEPDVDEEIMKSVKNLYVRNLLISTSQEKIQKIVEKAIGSKITHIKMIKDYAFIHFAERSHAERAMKKLQGIEIDGSKIEIKWAKPVDRETYKDMKLMKGNSKFKNYTNQTKDERANTPKDEGLGGSSTCSLTDQTPETKSAYDEYDLAPARLESICKTYNWGTPMYTYNKCSEIFPGVDMWQCSVEIPYVGVPLFLKPVKLGPLSSTPALTMRLAKARVAEMFFDYITYIRDHSVMWVPHNMYPQQVPVLPAHNMWHNPSMFL